MERTLNNDVPNVAELIPVATEEKKGFMPANFFVNSSIYLPKIGTYHIISYEGQYSYGNFIINVFTNGLIGESRLLLVKSDSNKVSKAIIKGSITDFRVFYTITNGKADVYLQSSKGQYIITPAMDYRYNQYQPKLICEESEIPSDAVEFDYE